MRVKIFVETKRKGSSTLSQEFNKQLMLDNISFMLKELGKKIGEFEAEAGVSAGYVSRMSKEDSKKPAVDFVMKAAEALKISVSTLLSADLSVMSPTERYLVGFVEKLTSDTRESKLAWDRQSQDYLNDLPLDDNGEPYHPLFDFEHFQLTYEDESTKTFRECVFKSRTFEYFTIPYQSSYALRMKNGAMLYVMNITIRKENRNEETDYAKEIWMYKPGVGRQFLCSNKEDSTLASLIDDLYKAIFDYSKHPMVKKGLKEAIDAFFNDDLEDDPVSDDGLPF